MIQSNSKLYRMLQSLNQDEWSRLEDHVHSPAHNKSANPIRLFDLLRPWFPVEASESEEQMQKRSAALDRKALFGQIFPGQEYKEGKFSNLTSTCTRIVERFWVQEALESDPLLQGRLLAAQLRNREGLQEDFARSWRDIVSEAQPRTVSDQYHLLELQEEMLSFQIEQHERSEALILPQMLEQLQRFVLSLSLKYQLAAISRMRLVETPLDTGFLAHINAWPMSSGPGDALIRLYACTIACLQEPENTAAYQQLKAAFVQDIDQLAPGDAQTLYYTLLNYLNGRHKAGTTQVIEELFFFYRGAYERGHLFSGPYIDAHVFTNLVMVCSGVIKRETDPQRQEELRLWRSVFVEENRERLRPALREMTLHYVEAYIHYEEKAYSAAYRILSSYKHPDIFADITRRILLLRVYFDADDPELFDAQAKSAWMYISRAEQVAAPKREAYNHFVRLTRRLFALRGKPETARDLARIREEILALPSLEGRAWLIEKCGEMGG